MKLARLRKSKLLRDWVSEAHIGMRDIIMPCFVLEGKNVTSPIDSMPGILRFSVDNLVKELAKIKGLRAILLFGVSSKKDEIGSGSYRKTSAMQMAIRAIKKEFKDMIVMTDVCLCGYTTHGHCGIISSEQRKAHKDLGVNIDLDKTLKTLARIALSHAEEGADFVAPSAMMDNQVEVIREALDKNGFKNTAIMAYSAKYASSFFAPFRDALESSPQFGDRKSYQMDYRNSDEALKEIKQDIDEGADMVMVKPALAYLDIIYRAKENFNVPIAAYNVSGEYALVKRYCETIEDLDSRYIIEKELALEILTSIKRAGADFIITYWAKDLGVWLSLL